MFVNFEFLGPEPIENVITFMNFRMDAAVFFGYSEVIESQRSETEAFLKKYCNVRQIKFLPLSHTDLDSVIKTMRLEIKRELSGGNDIFFDITGGESLILVAFGSLSKEFEAPMHMYDVEKNELFVLNRGCAASILDKAQPQKAALDLDRFIELHGGTINYDLQKGIKEDNSDVMENIDRLWPLSLKHEDVWNPFSNLCKACFKPGSALNVNASAGTAASYLRDNNAQLTPARACSILRDLNDVCAISGFQCSGGRYSFRYASEAMKECLWEGGSILEMYVYSRCREIADYSMAGVHIDWDGVIHSVPGKDVLNEVDVLALMGNVPVFISCKSGKMGANQTLHALYELQAVAGRFGGKYARKVLVSVRPLAGEIYMERAKEMKIDVKILGNNMA